VLQLVSELKQRHLGQSVVFVSHGEVIGNFVGMIDGATLAGRFEAHVANGSICAAEAAAASLPRLLLFDFSPAKKKAAEVLGAGASRPAARRLAAP
jgi:broad specificity phosphatase PhoE